MKFTPTRKLLKRAAIVVGLLVVAVVAAVAALPKLAGTPPVRRWIVAQANAMLAPTKVEVATLGLSWTGPTRMTGVVLRDPNGKAVVTAPSATLDRSLWQLAFDRPRYGTLTLDGAAVDIERRADGSIDLADALEPILRSDPDTPSDPTTDFTLVVSGTLKLASPELDGPMTADALDLTLRVPAAPTPLDWTVALANTSVPTAETLDITGHYDQRAAEGTTAPLALTVVGRGWPLAVAQAGVVARGRFDGKAEVALGPDGLVASGDAAVAGLDASGPALQGDRLRWERVGGTWDLARSSAGEWDVRRLDLAAPVGGVKASGTLSTAPGASSKIEAHLDLAALARQAPHLLRIRDGLTLERGTAKLDAEVRPLADGGRTLAIEAGVSDLLARDAARSIALDTPATLSASLALKGGTFVVEKFAAKASFVDLNGSGDLERGVNLTGVVDLGAFQTQLRDLIDFGTLDLAGRATVRAAYRRTGPQYAGRALVEFRGLKVDGLGADPIRHAALTIDASADGPATADGLPAGWAAGKLALKGDDLTAQVAATSREGTYGLSADVAVPFQVSGKDGRAEARVVGRWAGSVLEVDDARLALRPADPAAQAAALAVLARGRFDTADGSLTLAPTGQSEPGAITPTAEGVRASGLGKTGAATEVEGGVQGDIAALDLAKAYWTDSAPTGFGGAMTARVKVRREPTGVLLVAARAESADLSFPRADGKGRRPEGPLVANAHAVYHPDADHLRLSETSLETRYGTIAVDGDLADLSGHLWADLKGTLVLDSETLAGIVARSIEPGAKFRGTARPFRLKGALSGESTAAILRGLDAEFGIDVEELQAFGLKAGPTAIVARVAGGQVVVEPIGTTLNGGRVDLRPEVRLDDPAGLTLAMAPGSGVTDVEINDEVSDRVLSFIAPVLHQATQVRGHVSAVADRVEIPLDGAAGRSTNIVAKVTFREVTYGPGPFAEKLIGLTGSPINPGLRLDRTVDVTVADGKVTQSGLAVAVGREVEIALDGSVGIDGSLALRAGVPVTAGMLGGDRSLLGSVVGGTRVGVPIGGTLSHPAIDRRALQVGLRDASRSLIQRGAAAGASRLLERYAPAPAADEAGTAPVSPDAPAAAPSPAPAPGRPTGEAIGRSIAGEALKLLGPKPAPARPGATPPPRRR